jgi:hypothetical protein
MKFQSSALGRSRLDAIVLLTVLGWLIVTMLYLYWWTESIMADPTQHDYEGIWTLPVLGFVMYRLPLLLIVLFVIIALELLLVREPQKSNWPSF